VTIGPGSRLGPYEITAKLGEGGMGEVYRATDTKLERQVAIKVLPAAFTEDEARLSRFEREAKLLAQLHHPHIASIFGIEDADGIRALVMELVEGPTLAERLAGGPLPTDEALPIARQIAEALELAHDKGIIHRDLKPQNIKLTVEGQVKVLDFGLAKAMDPGGASGVASPMASPTMMSSPTLTAMPETQLGVILGTAAYMAPEQARGHGVDKRADIWAFGVVLYEMLTGGKLFVKDTVSDTLAAVIRKEVDLDLLPEDTPPAIRRLLRRCLERNPKERLRDIGDARLELQEERSTGTAAVPADRRRRPWLLPAGLVVGLLLGAGLARVLVPAAAPALPSTPARLTLKLPAEAPLAAGNFLPALDFSPDGKALTYVALGAGGIRQLAVRPIDSTEVRILPGTEGAEGPFFSPDGEWIGFWSQWKIRKVRTSGAGLPEVICDAVDFRGATWAGHTIVLANDQSGPLVAVDESGGTPRELTTLNPGETGHRYPQALPDGDTVLFTSWTAPFDADRGTLSVVSLETGQRAEIGKASIYSRYSPTGHLLYVQAGRLLAVPFDPESHRIVGEARAILSPVLMQRNTGATQFAVSPAGHLAWVEAGYVGNDVELVRASRSGERVPIFKTTGVRRNPSLSPDDSEYLVTGIGFPDNGMWLMSVDGSEERLLVKGVYYGEWLPGRRWVHDLGDAAEHAVVVESLDGTSPPVTLLSPAPDAVVVSGTSEGWVSYTAKDAEGDLDAWILDSKGGGEPVPFLAGPDNEGGVTFSPEGRYVAYVSDRSGRFEVYVTSFPDKAATWQISTTGGSEVVWRGDGQEITFRSGGDLVGVPVTTDPTFRAGTPAVLLPVPYYGVLGSPHRPNYDVSRDGSWFLVVNNRDLNEPVERLEIALDWQSVFKAK
jgi:eukaryotic-like serine/threonine-protein kinase